MKARTLIVLLVIAAVVSLGPIPTSLPARSNFALINATAEIKSDRDC